MSDDKEAQIAALILEHARRTTHKGTAQQGNHGERTEKTRKGGRIKGYADRAQKRITRESRNKAIKIADLRAQGMSWAEVSHAMGYDSDSAAERLYKRALERGWM